MLAKPPGTPAPAAPMPLGTQAPLLTSTGGGRGRGAPLQGPRRSRAGVPRGGLRPGHPPRRLESREQPRREARRERQTDGPPCPGPMPLCGSCCLPSSLSPPTPPAWRPAPPRHQPGGGAPRLPGRPCGRPGPGVTLDRALLWGLSRVLHAGPASRRHSCQAEGGDRGGSS